jgi:hypothetical protein
MILNCIASKTDRISVSFREKSSISSNGTGEYTVSKLSFQPFSRILSTSSATNLLRTCLMLEPRTDFSGLMDLITGTTIAIKGKRRSVREGSGKGNESK